MVNRVDAAIDFSAQTRVGESVLTRHRRPLPALTGLRFFAAMYVVTFHTRVGSTLLAKGYVAAGRFFFNGYLAVPLFFMLSGFILAYTYRGQIETRAYRVRFWEARFARIWPAYAFSLLCSSIVNMHTVWMPSFWHAIATLAMVQAWNPWHPEDAGTWNMVCWTLSVEAFFYVVFPWFQSGLERLTPRRLGFAGMALMAVGIACNVSSHTLSNPVYGGILRFIIAPVIHLPEFLIGMVAGNLLLEELEARGLSNERQWPVFSMLGAVASLIALATVEGRWTSLVLPGFALLLYGLASEQSWIGRVLSTRALMFGGAISYSIYLLQTPVRIWIHAIPALNQPGKEILNLVWVPIMLLPLAAGTYLLIEEPSRRALRRLFATAWGR